MKLRKSLELMSALIHHEEQPSGAVGGTVIDTQQQAQALLGMLHSGRGRGSSHARRVDPPSRTALPPIARDVVTHSSAAQMPPPVPSIGTNTVAASFPPTILQHQGVGSKAFPRLSLESSPLGFHNNSSAQESTSSLAERAHPPNASAPTAAPIQQPGLVLPAADYFLPAARNPSQTWVMGKWPLRFGGRPNDLPVDEFIFRTETLARQANLSQPSLALGLHQILNGSSASWY